MLVWAMSVLLMIGFMSVSMFATLPGSAPFFPFMEEEDSGKAVIGEVVDDCRVMIQERGRLKCMQSMEYREDGSKAVELSTRR